MALKEKVPFTLTDALIKSRTRLTTDSRDHVYSKLGLVTDTYGLAPNYEMCASCLYSKVVKRIITRDQCLDILSACKSFNIEHRYRTEENIQALPAMVDWVRFYPILNRLLPAQLDRKEYEGRSEKNGCLCNIENRGHSQDETRQVLSAMQGSYFHTRSWIPNWARYYSSECYMLLNQQELCHFRAASISTPRVEFLQVQSI